VPSGGVERSEAEGFRKIRVLSCNPVDVLRPEILYAIFDTTIPAIDHGEALFIGV
jgi:hypothetical protein